MHDAKAIKVAIVFTVALVAPALAVQRFQGDDPMKFHQTYNQIAEPTFQLGIQKVGFRGRDRSWVGGEDPSLHPSGS